MDLVDLITAFEDLDSKVVSIVLQLEDGDEVIFEVSENGG